MEYFDMANFPDLMSLTSRIHDDTYDFISPSKLNLQGKSVLVTGASRGIGKAIAVSFASAGCSKIALCSRQLSPQLANEIKEAAIDAGRTEPTVLSVEADITDESSVRAMADTVIDRFGGTLDVLVNNAGWSPYPKKIAESDPEDWWRTWEVNIKGTYLCCRFLLPALLKSSSKTIINLTSGAAVSISGGAAGYGGSKFAICRFTEHLHQEYKDQGLLSFAVSPGAVDTLMKERLHEDFHPYLTDKAELPANTIAWLVSERREWLSSRFINVKSNIEELMQLKDRIVQNNLLRFRITV